MREVFAVLGTLYSWFFLLDPVGSNLLQSWESPQRETNQQKILSSRSLKISIIGLLFGARLVQFHMCENILQQYFFQVKAVFTENL